MITEVCDKAVRHNAYKYMYMYMACMAHHFQGTQVNWYNPAFVLYLPYHMYMYCQNAPVLLLPLLLHVFAKHPMRTKLFSVVFFTCVQYRNVKFPISTTRLQTGSILNGALHEPDALVCFLCGPPSNEMLAAKFIQ